MGYDQGEVYCDRCGQVLVVGDYPYCPHGRSKLAIERDEIPGGVTVENYGPHPITFYSHSERRAYMKAHGLVEREKFSPLPGTDVDPAGIPNPAGYKDEKTLENGAALLLRQQKQTAEPEYDPVAAGELILFNSTGTLPKSRKKRERKYGITGA
jgi:hypothetical protein